MNSNIILYQNDKRKVVTEHHKTLRHENQLYALLTSALNRGEMSLSQTDYLYPGKIALVPTGQKPE
jgi:hypothetical protein